MSGIESSDESFVFVFGTEICKWARAKFLIDEEALVTRCLCESLFSSIDGLPTVFSPRELAVQRRIWHDAHMRIGASTGILFQLSQQVHDFICVIKIQDLKERMRFDHVLCFWSYGTRTN